MCVLIRIYTHTHISLYNVLCFLILVSVYMYPDPYVCIYVWSCLYMYPYIIPLLYMHLHMLVCTVHIHTHIFPLQCSVFVSCSLYPYIYVLFCSIYGFVPLKFKLCNYDPFFPSHRIIPSLCRPCSRPIIIWAFFLEPRSPMCEWVGMLSCLIHRVGKPTFLVVPGFVRDKSEIWS